ncbi:MAG: Nif3-like dinuclear metal center hexameric protein [Anaerocolumna sp.]
MTVKEIIDKIIEACHVEVPVPNTCDILHAGNEGQEIKKIGVCFMADVEVIKKARAAGIDLLITHEPTFYSSLDDYAWLEGNPVYEEKRKLIETAGISIWRFHDYMHRYKPDLIYEGWKKEMGWEDYLLKNDKSGMNHHFRIPGTSLEELIAFFKQKLNMNAIRVIGNPQMLCRDIGVLVGGGSLGLGDESMPSKMISRKDIDTLVCGEIIEWTTLAFIRDAVMQGKNKAVIVLGHNRTEEAGMKHLPDWLKKVLPGYDIEFIASGDPVEYR